MNGCFHLMLRKRRVQHLQCKLPIGRGLGKEQCPRCSNLLRLQTWGSGCEGRPVTLEHELEMCRGRMCVKWDGGFGFTHKIFHRRRGLCRHCVNRSALRRLSHARLARHTSA